eukprot:TRINITY_DN1451_c0_g1_i1.p1 TRINITY_DN1451_c0_g1~~TRINITY_DN1451_c0_g1_i1.p1  ORF type:complete len:294 (+),score=48.15 TRINITY_DN1451_c0_g1_i1:39-920(+)
MLRRVTTKIFSSSSFSVARPIPCRLTRPFHLIKISFFSTSQKEHDQEPLLTSEQEANYFEIRKKSVEEYEREGQNIYPHIFSPNLTLGEFVEKYNSFRNGHKDQNTVIKVAGRLMSKRTSSKKLHFYDLQGQASKIQIMAPREFHEGQDQYDRIHKILKKGDIVGIEGFPGKSQKGELSIFPTNITLLSPCLHPLPGWHGLKNQERRFRERYLDLILSEETKKIFLCRSKIIRFVRCFLEERGFLEVETPILSPKVGGAIARPFQTFSKALDTPLYLRIAPELHLKVRYPFHS